MAQRYRYLLIFIVVAYILFPSAAQVPPGGNPALDSLINAVGLMKNDSAKVMALNEIGFRLSSSSPYDGIQYGIEAQLLAQQLKYRRGEARSNSVLGANYFSLSDYPNAYKYWLAALTINEEVNHLPGVANHLHNIGMVFFSQKEYDKALDYYNRALEVSRQMGDESFATHSYTAIGKIYAEQKNYTQSLENHFKALALDKNSGNQKAMSTDMLNIGAVYAAQGDVDRARDILLQSLDIKKKIKDKNGIASVYNQLGKLFFAQQEVILAKSYLDSAVAISKETGNLDNLQNNYEYLARAEELLGNYKQALANYREYYTIRDSIYSDTRKSEIYNLEKKAKIEERKRMEEKEILRQDRIMYIQMAGISLFIVIMIGVALFLSKIRVKKWWVEILSTLSIILIFEFIQLLLHGTIVKITHHDLLLTYLCLLAIAGIVIPAHHKVEEWVKRKLGIVSTKNEPH